MLLIVLVIVLQLVVRRQWIDDLLDFSDPGTRYPAEFGRFCDVFLTFGEIDTKRFATRYIGVLPLYRRADIGKGLVRGTGCAAKLGQRELPDSRNITFDHEAFHLEVLLCWKSQLLPSTASSQKLNFL